MRLRPDDVEVVNIIFVGVIKPDLTGDAVILAIFREWTRSIWADRFKYPYQSNDGREKIIKNDNLLRVLRGGSYFYEARNVRCAYRFRFNPDIGKRRDGGFRVVVSHNS